MASSASSSWRYHVFPSFSGQDVRKSFLSHLLEALRRKSIDTFIDNSIERSLPIDPALLLAIKESRISIVIFSKNYASSTWCLNELVEIHKCFKELKQMVIPIFYDVVPSDVRKQTGEFGKLFEETCKDKPEDHKERWMQALSDVAKMAGYDLLKWPDEANLIESLTNDVSNKLFTPSSDVGDFVGVEAHLERLSSKLCLESEEARMVGIVGPSGIGKSTIGRALYSQHFSKFHHHAIVTYKRTINDDYGMKLSWEQQFLSKILGQNDIKIDNLGEVEKRLKHKKVLIVLDDVDDLELLKTLVGKPEWFGAGSKIIVITQDIQLLKAHEIVHIHEVEFPSEGLALEMLCRYAFGKNSPPDGFRELAVEVAKLAGNLPLGLSVLGSSLKGKGKDDWVEMLPRLRDDLDGRIEKTLRVSYDRLDKKDKELFLSIACFFKGKKVSVIKDLFGIIGLRMLADKFLIRITPKEYKFRIREKTPEETVEMHDLLQKLGIEIDREESERQTSRRRFLTNAEDIRDVLTDNNGIKSVLGISLEVTEPFSIDEKSIKGMPNLQYIIIHHNFWMMKFKEIRLDLPQCLSYLPRKLKLLEWVNYPAKCLPSNFNAENLVILTMMYSKLEKLWEGNQPLGSLKEMDMSFSEYLKEIPDLSNAINLEKLNLRLCKSLVTLVSSFQSLESLVTLDLSYCTNLTEIPDLSNAINLEVLNLRGCESLVILASSFQSLESLVTLDLSFCTNLTEIPDLSNAINLEVLNLQGCESLVTLASSFQNVRSLKYFNLKGCCQLRNFPQIEMTMTNSFPQRIMIKVEDCLWNKNLRGPNYLDCLMKCIPSKCRPEHFVKLTVSGIMLKKLWEGVQSLGRLVKLNLSFCKNLTEFPDLSKATNLEYLYILKCESLVRVPSTIGNLQKLKEFDMSFCDGLEVLPENVNLAPLSSLNLRGCSRLRTFPQISKSIKTLILDGTAIEEVPCCIGNFSRLTSLKMTYCESLKNICPNIFRLTRLQVANFSNCAMATTEGHFSCGNIEKSYHVEKRSTTLFNFCNCSKLDGDARELILRSCFKFMVLPGGEVPTYFKHRASGNKLTITLPQSSLSQEFLRFQACVVVGHSIKDVDPILNVHLYFNDEYEYEYEVTDHFEQLDQIRDTDYLVSCSFKFRPLVLPSKLDFNVIKFYFSSCDWIKGCGVQLLSVSPSPDVCNGSSETEYNQQFGEKADVVETGRSKKRMRMTSGTSEEHFNLPFGQIVADTGLTALDLELSLGQGEVSSVSSYPCVEGEALITELQDADIPIVDKPWKERAFKLSESLPYLSELLLLRTGRRIKSNSEVSSREVAVEVANLASNLPLVLSALGSSLKGRGKHEWVEMMPRLRNDLDWKIEKTLRVSYDLKNISTYPLAKL